MKSFASDNYAGVLPEMMNAIHLANNGHARSYGADPITRRAADLFRSEFGPDTQTFFVFNGTGANVLSISTATQSFNSVLCTDTSHIYNDESSAPETFTGCRYFPLTADADGKMTPGVLRERLIRKGDVHYAQSSLVSITQATEYGTVYTPAEIRTLVDICHENGLCLHMDGSRFFNAAASLGCSLADISSAAGVDILSLGGTKAGMMYGEAVLIFNPALSVLAPFKHKQVIQLASKTRFIAAQFEAMISGQTWKKHAAHANHMAGVLRTALAAFPEVRFTKPSQANAVFAEIPRTWYEPLQEHYPFYVWKESTHEVRLMCSWDTTESDIQGFSAAIASIRQN
jgi:threonine aldolase